MGQYLNALSNQFPVGGHVDFSTGEMPPLVVKGLCAVDPRIEFGGNQFVFTGESERADRDEMERLVHVNLLGQMYGSKVAVAQRLSWVGASRLM